jgi:hypothetical protein
MRRRLLITVLALLMTGLQALAADGERPRKLTTQELAKWIDDRIEAEYARANAATPVLADDATFLRRVFLDLQGHIPSVAQSRDFLADDSSFKRPDYVDRLLNDHSRQNRFDAHSADNLARIWRRMMVPASSPGAAMAAQIDPWLAKQFSENVPYDEVAKRLLMAKPPQPPQPGTNRPAPNPDIDALAGVFQQAVGPTPENLTGAFVRVFLGVRLNCAQCHDHPFTEWKQRDFWGLAAFFQANARPSGESLSITPMGDGQLTYAAKLLWTDQPLKELPAEKMPRQVVAEWIVSPYNPNFAATAVNRFWQHLCGQGLAGSVDELDRVTPAERRLLNDLAELFIDANYDMRWLIAGICKSKVYQQAAAAESDANGGLVRRPLKALLAEQIFDSLEVALGLPVGKADHGPRFSGERQQFVSRMNEAAPEAPADYHAGIPQALTLMNGKLTADATSLDSSRTLRAVIEAPFLSPQEKIETLYLAVLSRRPRPTESSFLLGHLERQTAIESQSHAYAEIMWGLLNSPEFVLSK